MTDSATSQVLAAAGAIVSAFGSHQTETYFAGFSPAASFIFYTHDSRLESRADYESLWAEWERDGFRVHSCKSSQQRVQFIADDSAVFMHEVETVVEIGGETDTVRERETIVFNRGEGGWVAVHEHLSPASGSPAVL